MRRLVAAGLIAAPVLLGAAPALAQEQAFDLSVDASAWSWARVVPAAAPGGPPSNVPAGGLAVAFEGRPGTAAKATYLRLALGAVPVGSVPTSLRLVMKLAPEHESDPAAAPVIACRLKGPFTTGDGVDPAAQPAEDCAAAPAGKYDAAAGTMTFDLTSAAVDWLSSGSNTGVVLRPPVDAAAPAVLPYQLVFSGAGSVVGELTASLPAGAAPPPVVAGPPVFGPAVPQPPLQSGTVPLAPVGPVFGPPAVTAPVPGAVAAPAPAAPVVVSPVVARHPLAAARVSAAGFFTAGVGALALLCLIAWVVGDTGRPREFARRERARLDRLRMPGLEVVPTAPGIGQATQRRQGRKPLASASSTVTYS